MRASWEGHRALVNIPFANILNIILNLNYFEFYLNRFISTLVHVGKLIVAGIGG